MMIVRLSILYRGPLASCNYDCAYCPFAKHTETAAERVEDTSALERFVGWVESRHDDHLAVLFTPWGEALTRGRYQRALIRLMNTPHVAKAAIQTNLSCPLDRVEDCDKSKLGLLTTYHPSEVARRHFLARCFELSQRGVNFSVGVLEVSLHRDEAGSRAVQATL